MVVLLPAPLGPSMADDFAARHGEEYPHRGATREAFGQVDHFNHGAVIHGRVRRASRKGPGGPTKTPTATDIERGRAEIHGIGTDALGMATDNATWSPAFFPGKHVATRHENAGA